MHNPVHKGSALLWPTSASTTCTPPTAQKAWAKYCIYSMFGFVFCIQRNLITLSLPNVWRLKLKKPRDISSYSASPNVSGWSSRWCFTSSSYICKKQFTVYLFLSFSWILQNLKRAGNALFFSTRCWWMMWHNTCCFEYYNFYKYK